MARSGEIERAIDRYLGIPLVFLLGVVRRHRAIPNAPERIGIIQPTAIGDMILLSGLLRHLKELYPIADIHVFHGPTNAAIIPLLPVQVISHPCDFRRPWQVLRELRGAQLDLLIDCVSWPRLTALLTALSGARATIGFRSPGQYIHPAFDSAVAFSLNVHEVQNYRSMAELFGPVSEFGPCLCLGEPGLLKDLPFDRLILMHMIAGGSRARQKQWPAEHWIDLSRRLADCGFVIGFTGSTSDQIYVQDVIDRTNLAQSQCISLVGQYSLAQLAHLLMRAPLLVSIDTGIAHLAAALGCTVVGMYGPTRFERWGAINAVSVGLNSPHPAAGYIHYGFEKHPQGDEIMARLSVDEVFSVVMTKLKRSPIEQEIWTKN